MNSVPVALPDLYAGFGKVTGLVRDEGEHLCLEYQIRVFDLFRSGVRQVRIPLADVSSVTIQKGWFGLAAKVVIVVRRLEPVKDVPGMAQCRVALGVARDDLPAAEKFVADLHVPEPGEPASQGKDS